MPYTAPCFQHLTQLLGLYRLPSGRIAEIVQSGPGSVNITLRYLDDGEIVTLRKSWLAANCKVLV